MISNTGIPKLFTPAEVKAHDGREGNLFWAVIDGYVCDCTDCLGKMTNGDKDKHPGGEKKLLSTDHPSIGATGQDFGFSFSKGKNAHYPETAKTFDEGVQRYLNSSM